MTTRRYLLEFGAGMAAYGFALIATLYLLNVTGPDVAYRPVLSLLPMIPAVAVAWAVVRQLRRLDEMQRLVQFEALGLAFAATALVTVSYGFLEIVGFPKISMFAIWPLMAVFWLIGTTISRWRYR